MTDPDSRDLPQQCHETVWSRVAVSSIALPGWDAARVVDAAVSLGATSIEWGVGSGQAIESPETALEVLRLCARAELRVAGLAVQDRGAALGLPDSVARYLQVARTLRAPYMRLFCPHYLGGPLPQEQAAARALYDAYVDAAASLGTVILVETSPGTLAPGPDQALGLVERHPPDRVGVLYDPGNMIIEGHIAPRLAVARLGAYLHHVHVKNIAWGRRQGAWRWRITRLAQGLLDWRELHDVLAAADFEGRFSIDHLGGTPSRALLARESAYLGALMRGPGEHSRDVSRSVGVER